ncbi:MAG: poly(R)-hydroxyalkanoic acid synthase subunit PhaE [Rhizobiaceae bacterium]|nr:poly(R)-hydroxyalkanoic acid synthase subunit PhaE [Rhizobiaceae bacterium]
MSNDKSNEGFEALATMWQQSQEAFVNAQKEVGEQFQKSLNQMAGTAKPDTSDPIAAWQNLIKAWVPAWDTGPTPSVNWPGDLDFRKGHQAFFELLDPQKWTQYAPEQLRVMLERIAHGPQFADLVMPQQQMANAWRETLDYQQAASDMSKVMQKAWTAAYETYSQSYALEDLQSGEMNEALNAWLKSANEALLEAQGSSDFLDAQKRMIRASTEIRARQRDMAETWSDAWQMPTRTEVDDLTRTVHQLRRELRELKREVANLNSTGK